MLYLYLYLYINIIHKEIHSILKCGTSIIITLLFGGMSAFSKILSVGGKA